MRLTIPLFILLSFSIYLASAALWGNNNNNYNYKDRVLLKDVQVITLRKGERTAGRRVSPIPQISCVGGSARSQSHEVDTVQCKNMGFDGNDYQWKCEADLDSKIRFGKIEVLCEGFDYPDDPYILRGSCGLEYTLEYTNQGRQQQQQQHYNTHNTHNTHHNYNYDSSHSSGGGSKLKTLLMLGIVVFIFYNIYKQCVQMGSHNNANNTGSFGGGGYPNNGPYGGPGGFPPGGYPPGGYPGSGYPSSGPYGCNVPPPPPTQSWRPGFWTGLATGGFMGNWFNRGPRYSYGTRYSTPTFSSGPSFSSGGGSSFSSGSSSRSSSGFGGTRRR